MRQIVELHGGQVTAESAGQGLGACFTITLPVLAPSSSTIEEQTPEGTLDGASVLLGDDNEDGLAEFSMLLEMEGAIVTACSSARDALALLDEIRFDLVLSDINMPDMDGNMFIQELRRDPRHSTVPALAITGLGRQEDIDLALAAGFSGHVGKPVDMRELARQVERLAVHRGGR